MKTKSKYSLIIGWLYPDLMSIYGDRGNIITLQKRCEWRGIAVEIRPISLDTNYQQLAACDLLMMGGAQDNQQTIVAKDLEKKKKTLAEMIEAGIPGLYVCGGFQFLGKYYKEADGTVIEQLGILDVYTENPGNRRLIGNIAIEVDRSQFTVHSSQKRNNIFVGFENHGGRTILGKHVQPLGKVLAGFGSNDSAKEEGAVYKNSIGTYLHGPILPKNPELADWLITKALEKKYKTTVILESEATPESRYRQSQTITFQSLDDSLANKAREVILERLKIKI